MQEKEKEKMNALTVFEDICLFIWKHRVKLLLLATVICFIYICSGCAGIPVQKPENPNQCFESKLNPWLFGEWKSIGYKDGLYFAKNPKPYAKPKVVALLTMGMGQILGYAYLERGQLMVYTLDAKDGKPCYIRYTKLKPKDADHLKSLLRQFENHKACSA